MQALAEALAPLARRARRAAPGCSAGSRQFAELYERYGPVIRAWTEAEIGGSEFGRLGTDVLTAVHRRARRPHRARSRRPTSTRPIAALALVAMLERLNYYALDRTRCASSPTRSPRRSRASPTRALFGADRSSASDGSLQSPSPPSTRACRSPSSDTGPGVRDLALDEHDGVVGDAERVVHVLLDDEQRRARVADRARACGTPRRR